MASVIRGALQITFAAISFAGAGYLFKYLDHSGHRAEVKRHNKAIEDLSKAKETYENEIKQHDKVQQLRQQLADANADMEDTNRALDTLRKVQTMQYNGVSFNRKPQLSDFYKPSDEMEYQITIGVIGIGAGYLVHKLV